MGLVSVFSTLLVAMGCVAMAAACRSGGTAESEGSVKTVFFEPAVSLPSGQALLHFVFLPSMSRLVRWQASV